MHGRTVGAKEKTLQRRWPAYGWQFEFLPLVRFD